MFVTTRVRPAILMAMVLVGCGQDSANKCTQDTECKAGRVCSSARCVESTAPPTVREEPVATGSVSTQTQTEIATTAVKKWAFEAYPQWAAANPSKACPAALADMVEYIAGTDLSDPWGHPYQMYCGTTLPPGARGLAVSSAGPDQKEGTTDDIRSWD